jgi:hypothetical protein
MSQKVVSKRLLIDSGCNTNIIASQSHSHKSIIYRDSDEGISTANGRVVPIVGQGSMLQMPADYAPTFVDRLLSVSQITTLRNSCFIFLKDVAFNVCSTPSVINLLIQIYTLAVEQNLVLCTANLTHDNLYSVNTTATDNPTSPLLANATYYTTAQLDTVADVVRYFHESRSHCSMDLMIHILKNNVFTNIPSILTEKAIRKYFPKYFLIVWTLLSKPPSCFSTSSADLFSYIEKLFQLSFISNYRGLLSALYMKDNDKFIRQSCVIYIQNVTNLLITYPFMFDLQHGGTTQKYFTLVFLDGVYPVTLRQAVRDRGPET